MRKVFYLTCIFLGWPSVLYAFEIRGEVAFEARLFAESPSYVGQRHHNGSLALDVELFQQVTQDLRFVAEPFYRLDSADTTRSHGDLRTCNVFYAPEAWELTAGFEKVFWGVTEFVHLVDIINQTDLLEGLDGEDKLGQPMVRLRLERDWGMVDTFLLPYFRTRRFPGEGGRLRGPVVIDDSNSQFESSMEEYHPDTAIRFSSYLGDWDFGLYQFWGTSREPLFVVSSEDASLIPYYEQIGQTGLDLQLTRGGWLWKVEALSRCSDTDEGLGAAMGFEYTFPGVLGSSADLGLLGEYVFDDRNVAEYSLYNDDLMAGVRLSVNDHRSTELLLGVIQDTEYNSTAYSLELSSRINDHATLEITGAILAAIDSEDPAGVYRQDSFIRILLTCYF